MAKCDIVLLHTPSVYDFRNRDDILFAYLGNSDSVHVSAVFEMPPVGLLAIRSHLRRRGCRCEFFNLAARMLKDQDFDVEDFLARLDSPLFGIDLHWLAHAHGSLAVAELVKQIHPNARTLFGGITSTYYHEELVSYPQVDYVLRGFDTLKLVEALVRSHFDEVELGRIPSLTWQDQAGDTHINEFSAIPNAYQVAVNWSEVFTHGNGKTPYHLIIPQAGCEYNCRWCGGSRYFFSRHMGINSPAHKPPTLLTAEINSLPANSGCSHTVTMIDFWHEYDDLLQAGLAGLRDANIASVHYCLHGLPPIKRAQRMCRGIQAVIELSPDSHDLEVAKASGRGCYTMDEMEAFIDALLGYAYSIEVYFMIGLPRQTPASVMETVDYCAHLLRKYRGNNVIPFICPMLPFLDPGSIIYDHPETWGYTLFSHTLEDHRRALTRMNWKQRLNYETRWLSKDDLVNISYAAVRRLTALKTEIGLLPHRLGEGLIELIDQTVDLMRQIDTFEATPDGPQRQLMERELRSRIRAYNDMQLYHVRSQQRPADLGFARDQWFDTNQEIDAVLGQHSAI
jgi:clorobiocin biosynthesis protein CloN6